MILDRLRRTDPAPNTDADTRADAIARIEAHRPQPFTCASCGISFTAKRSEIEPVVRPLLNGTSGVYGLCADCKAYRSEAAAVASLFDLDPDEMALNGLAVTWYADMPHAMPSRPNSVRWAHLDLVALAERVQERRREVDQRRGGPCVHCGTTLTNEGGQWWRGPHDRLYCHGCWEVLDLLGHGPARRDGTLVTVAGLCGGVISQRVKDLPRDFAQQVGFRGPKGQCGDRPFEYLDIGAMRRRAKAYLTRVGWRWADEYDPEKVGPISW